ncbi:MAG: hypothetical protein CV089_02260 [Nitrospira sp. WS110]|nr:hypothetical protein [Nitrospira sp. WS110]
MKRLYNRPEAAEYLGRTPRALEHLTLRGVLPFVRIGKRIQYDIEDLKRLIEEQKETYGPAVSPVLNGH